MPAGISISAFALLFTFALNSTHSMVITTADGNGADAAVLGETTITYQNAPGLNFPSGSGYGSDEVDLTQVDFLGTDVGGQSSSFSSAALDTFLNQDTDDLVTFILADFQPVFHSNAFFFSTKEQGTKVPTLSFDEGPAASVPVGNALLLMLLGLVSFPQLRHQSIKSWRFQRHLQIR